MKSTHRIWTGLVLSLIVLLAVPLGTVAAQENGGGFTEPFDDPQLANWEHSPEAIVKDGVLVIGPGNVAIRLGDFSDFTAEFKVRFTGPGLIFFRFHMRDDGDNAVIFEAQRVSLERTAAGQPSELAGAEWSGFSGDWDTVKVASQSGQYEVSVNGQVLLQTQETGEAPGGGSLGFMVDGESSAEFDDLSVALIAVEGGGEEMAPAPAGEQTAPAAATAQPTAQSGIGALLAQLSGSQASPPEFATFTVNLLLSVVLAFVLSRVYIYWGSALSNRRRFAANFILITITTTFIILIVRSSVALSLGLVGALSIVRFRAAIKEPEELAYLFFAIGIGIGLGDNQRLITVVAMAAVVAVIGIARLFRGRQSDFNLHLTVTSGSPDKVSLEAVTGTLKKYAAQSRLVRYDEDAKMLEVSYLVEFRNSAEFEAAKNALQSLSKGIQITFLDNKGIG
jgi:hypothetical protein